MVQHLLEEKNMLQQEDLTVEMVEEEETFILK